MECVLSFVFSYASSQPTVYQLVIKAMLNTREGGVFIWTELHVDHIPGHLVTGYQSHSGRYVCV
jgi:hypothetical protein